MTSTSSTSSIEQQQISLSLNVALEVDIPNFFEVINPDYSQTVETTTAEKSKEISTMVAHMLATYTNVIFPMYEGIEGSSSVDTILGSLLFCGSLEAHLEIEQKQLELERQILTDEIKFAILKLYEDEADKCFAINQTTGAVAGEKITITDRINGDALARVFMSVIPKKCKTANIKRGLEKYINFLVEKCNDRINNSSSLETFMEKRMSPFQIPKEIRTGVYAMPGIVDVKYSSSDYIATFEYSKTYYNKYLDDVDNLLSNQSMTMLKTQLYSIIDNFTLNCETGYKFPPDDWMLESKYGIWLQHITNRERCSDGKYRLFMKNNNLPKNFPFVLCGRLYKCKHEYLPEHVATDRNLVVLSEILFLVNEDPDFQFLSCVEDDTKQNFNSSTLCLHEYSSLRQSGIAWFRRQNNKMREICIGYKESKRLTKDKKLLNYWEGKKTGKVWSSLEMRQRENDPTLRGTTNITVSLEEKFEIVKKIEEKEKEIIEKKKLIEKNKLLKEKKLQKKIDVIQEANGYDEEDVDENGNEVDNGEEEEDEDEIGNEVENGDEEEDEDENVNEVDNGDEEED